MVNEISVSAEGWVSTLCLLGRLRRIFFLFLKAWSFANLSWLQGIQQDMVLIEVPLWTGRSGSGVFMSQHRSYAGTLSKRRQQGGRKKKSMHFRSSNVGTQTTLNKSSERKCTLSCVQGSGTQRKLRLTRNYGSSHCPTPDRHNKRGRPDEILYMHTSYCHLFYTSSYPSLAGWSPAKSPVMLQCDLSLLLGFTTSHSLVCCYIIIPFPSLLPLFRGQGKGCQRVWGAGHRSCARLTWG